MKKFIIFLYLSFSFETFAITIKQAMSEAYRNSPEILALRANLKASNQEISKVLGHPGGIISFLTYLFE